ncbi:MAG: ATP-binding protein, partial [Longimicrobiales bacterium]
MSRIRPRERDAILQSLSAGVVPRRGHQHIQVGRSNEIEALMRDLERIADGGAAVRFVIGRYGSGKTFFMHLMRSIGLEQGLVTMHADLAPDRRLQASGGQAQNLYQELAVNVATRTKPEGNALQSVVEKFIGQAVLEAKQSDRSISGVMDEKLNALSEMVGGYDFASVIQAYWKGHDEGPAELKEQAVRWLRGEYTTKTDVKSDLGIRSYVDDNSLYDHLKLFARFVRLAGYSGLLISLDEMVNLYKISHTVSRTANYEQILRIVNDCLQGSVSGLGFMMGGTPEFLMD